MYSGDEFYGDDVTSPLENTYRDVLLGADMNDHTCTKAECGHNCHYEPDLGNVRTIYGGEMDYDDQPCECEGHE